MVSFEVYKSFAVDCGGVNERRLLGVVDQVTGVDAYGSLVDLVAVRSVQHTYEGNAPVVHRCSLHFQSKVVEVLEGLYDSFQLFHDLQLCGRD